ncbi:amino acid permease [Myroides sp. LJL110]
MEDKSNTSTSSSLSATSTTNKTYLSRFAFFAMTASLFITVYEYPTFAQSGKALVFFLVACGILWFLPVALCSAELATIKGNQQGGIFSWVGNALGTPMGFAALFFQWFQITVGFVTMLYFVTGTVAAVFDLPALNDVPWIKFLAVVGAFWIITFLQFQGTQSTAKIAKYGFSFGIIVPVSCMFFLAVYYFSQGHSISTNFTQVSFIPNKGNIAALTSFVLAYMGVEASAPHATELNNFKRNYPLIMVALVIVGVCFSTIGGSVVSMVLQGNISSNEGIIDALHVLVGSSQYNWVVVALGSLICFGIVAQVSSWIVSPTAGLQYVADQGMLPAVFKTNNKKGVPVFILYIQGIIVTIWAAILTFGSGSSGGNISFQTAISLTVIIYLSAYILFFIAYFNVLLFKKDLPRAYQVPGGNIVKFIVASVGLLMSVAAILTAFVIPSSLSESEGKTYVILLLVSFAITLVLPFVIFKAYNKNKKTLPS